MLDWDIGCIGGRTGGDMALLLSLSTPFILSGEGGIGADLVRPIIGGRKDDDIMDDEAVVASTVSNLTLSLETEAGGVVLSLR